MPKPWHLFFDTLDKFMYLRVGRRTFGRFIGYLKHPDDTSIRVIQTGAHSYIAVPIEATESVEPEDLFAESQVILAAAIRQVRFFGLTIETIRTLLEQALLTQESRTIKPEASQDEENPERIEDKLARYRLIIAALIHNLDYSYDPARDRLYYIQDASQNQFVLMCLGWEDNFTRTCYPIFFIHLHNGAVWIECDNTERDQIYKALRDAGIPSEDLITDYIYP
jgi:DNA-binding transcriptional MerR regulator